MDDADVLQRIADQGLELPPPTKPVAAYVPVVVSGSLAFVAGQVPIIDGQVLHPGLLGAGVSVEQGYEGGAARRSRRSPCCEPSSVRSIGCGASCR